MENDLIEEFSKNGEINCGMTMKLKKELPPTEIINLELGDYTILKIQVNYN